MTLPPASLQQGTKDDDGKPRYDLLDPYAIDQLARVLSFGAQKYAPHNWRNGLTYSRLIAATLRHTFYFLWGQTNDPETRLHHMAHAMCCCMFIVGLGKDSDDRIAMPNEVTCYPPALQAIDDILKGRQ